MKLEFPVSYDNRMPCIIATLVADDHSCLFRQKIRYFSFAFISPLGTDNDRTAHDLPPQAINGQQKQKRGCRIVTGTLSRSYNIEYR